MVAVTFTEEVMVVVKPLHVTFTEEVMVVM